MSQERELKRKRVKTIKTTLNLGRRRGQENVALGRVDLEKVNDQNLGLGQKRDRRSLEKKWETRLNQIGRIGFQPPHHLPTRVDS